jgi:hypothetical protein
MKTTLNPKSKPKLRPEPFVPYADNPRFLKLYCAALTGLLSEPLTYFHPDHGNVPLAGKGEPECIKRRAVLAWNAACYASQEFEMETFNANVDHES